MSLSVLTIVKNRSDHLANLVEGLRRSAQAPDELVIVDMSDQPVDLPKTDFPSHGVRLETDGLPLARARNLAAAHAGGDHLLFLDVDCIPMRDLAGLMDVALGRSNALICAEVRYLGAGDAAPGWTETDLMQCGHAHPLRAFPQAGLRPEANAGLFWSLAFGLRREAFEALGGFDERFTGYGAEDTDFGFRARDAGLPLLFMGSAGAFHQHHGVFDPPLQHFDDILANAETFHRIWGVWPMTGWLSAFERIGLVRREGERLVRLRAPTPGEIEAARKPSHAPF
ncbi:glycosyltransferase [Brevundimonas sp.]|uniref:glycosyltransferase n=1 Tax=Brevundimonas sp. TaxID=1871086 RepID=UPI002ABA4951|nr:glycosyltransferase [Brevundimonas sp.]MDZ4362583.1 glycosyltransferase [Brevundimonas sp.]